MRDRSRATEADARLYRRVAWRLIPFLLLCYIVAMIDRLNVGYAKLQFLADLHFDEAVFGIAAGSLYVGYILCEVPSNLMLERIGLRLTLLRIMTLWGVFTMAMAFASTRWGFYGARFLIGAAEAGFFPGMVFYLTLWFPGRYRARMLALIAMGVPISGIVAGPVSSWIMVHMVGVGGLRGWQWLFLVEGVPAVLLGIAAYLVLPDRPEQAYFLSEDEKRGIARDLAADTPIDGAAQDFRAVVRRPRTYALALVYFAFYAAQSILLLWVPTLLRNSGVRDLPSIGWRAALVFLAGAIGMALVGWNSDRTGERRRHLVGSGLVAVAAFLILPLAAHDPDATTLCLAFASVAMFSFLALFWTVPTADFGAGARAGGIALVSSIGASGSALSPAFIGRMSVLTGSLYGAITVLAFIFLASLVALCLCMPAVRPRLAERAAC